MGVAEEAGFEEEDDVLTPWDDEDGDNKRTELVRRLDAFGLSLARTRSEAISDRQTSGIEDIWREDQDFFEGVDDLNRGDERSMRTEKPPVSGSNRQVGGKNQSRVFPNITGPFVESAAAHIADILLPTEDRPWSFDPTPIPELWEKAEEYAASNPEEAQQETKKGFIARVKDRFTAPNRAANEEASQGMEEQNPDIPPEEAFQQVQTARAIAKAAQERVWDWHVECQFNAEVRKCLEDASRVGTGIIKGPIPRAQMEIGWKPEHIAIDDFDNELKIAGEIVLSSDNKPVTKRIDCWNLYPARGCGENIQNGDYIWERDYLTKRQVRQLLSDDTYIAEQIKLVLEEGPSRAVAEAPESNSVTPDLDMRGKYEVWYTYCQAEKEDLEAAECDCEGLETPFIDVMVVMINNRVVKASLPTTDYGGYPYDIFNWRKRKNYWAGIGVSRLVRTAQKIVVGAARSMMNNAGLAGGPMVVFKQGVVFPADGVAGLAPRKIFYIKKDDQTIADATKAIGQVKVDIMVNEMMAIINFGLQMAENNSGFPLLMQGQMGGAPELVGVVNVLDKNTNAIKRRLARNFSDDVMNPHLRRYYIFHLMYGPDNEKGDLQVNVKGYASLVERDIQNQELGAMYSIVQDPRFGLDPKKWSVEYLKSRHLNHADLAIEDEQWAQMLQGWQQMMAEQEKGDPRVQVAQIQAQGKVEAEKVRGEYAGAIKISDNQFKSVKAQMDRQMELVRQKVNQEIAQLKVAGVSKNHLDKLKADIAREIMKIQSTFKLAGMEATAEHLPTPPMEPPGKAPPGQSFTQ